MLPDLNRERARISEAVASLPAARDRLDAVIAATEPTPADDPEACYAAGAATRPDDPGAPPRGTHT
jgi:chemotaxis regulatin CheY-phosphate phosphatase CheZ